VEFIKLTNADEKSRICEKVLRSLPKWFGIESAILNYIKEVQTMDTWIAVDKEPVGFVSINKHNKATAEIHVIGILPDYHRQEIGLNLVRAAQESLQVEGFKFLTVKTLSESRPNEEYDKTRKFYSKVGFFPVEEFKTLWGPENPCLLMIKVI
jgi:ribosomal protein S18 acetylase RimI-like enzyme